MFKYVKQEYRSLLIGSPKPELVWIHAASVGAACEIIVALGFGVDRTPASSVCDNVSIYSIRCMTENMRDQLVMELVAKLIGNNFEMSYVICKSSIYLRKG